MMNFCSGGFVARGVCRVMDGRYVNVAREFGVGGWRLSEGGDGVKADG